MDMGIHHYRHDRCEVETDGYVDPLQWWTTRTEHEFLSRDIIILELLQLRENIDFHCINLVNKKLVPCTKYKKNDLSGRVVEEYKINIYIRNVNK